jgi:putative ABC transport system permease protein
MLRGIGGDLRIAIRSLARTPAVTAAAILTLALGVGATTAMFSVANGLTFRPLPVRDPQRLVTITSDTALRNGFQAGGGWNYTMWTRLRERADAFDGAFAWALQRLDLSGGGDIQPANGLVVSAAFFDVLGVGAEIGRTFTIQDDAMDAGSDGPVAIISHDVWQRRFGGSSSVLGSRLLIEQVPVMVVGVAPAHFKGVDLGQPFDVAIPFGTEALLHGQRSLVKSDRALLLTVMLRLKPQQTIAAATVVLRAIQPDIVGKDVPPFLRESFVIVDASRGISDRSRLRQQYLYPLAILSIVSALVLVIVCLNIANLLLARASARRPAVSVRLAVGAPRWRVARLQLVEALMLVSAGAAAGLLFAGWASRSLVSFLPAIEGAVSIDLPIDWRVFAFIAAIAGLAVLLVGLAPALYASRVPPIEALRDAGRGASGRRVGVSEALVVVQIALSIVLLATAGLFVGTMNSLLNVPLGFDPRGLLVVVVNIHRSVEPSERPQLYQRALETVRDVPGVADVAASVWTPVGTGGGGLIVGASGRRPEQAKQVTFNFVTPGWFATYRTTVMRGREFGGDDLDGAPRVAVVNETLRRSLLPEGDAVGATIQAGPCSRSGCTVVGVVADAVYGQSLRDAAPPIVYVPIAQSAGLAPPNAPFRITVRAAGDLPDLTTRLAVRLRAVDSRINFAFRPVARDLQAAVAQERLLATLGLFFGGVALLLSAVGLYGISSHAANRRRSEIGIRLALGGRGHEIVARILARLALLVGAGVLLGALGTLWLMRFLAPLLYGLGPYEPVTIVVAAVILAVVAGAAGWIPLSRAARIDPARVLREV